MHQLTHPSGVVMLLAAMEELCHYSPDLLQAAGLALVKVCAHREHRALASVLYGHNARCEWHDL